MKEWQSLKKKQTNKQRHSEKIEGDLLFCLFCFVLFCFVLFLSFHDFSSSLKLKYIDFGA